MEHVYALEEKLQNAFNENAKLRVRQKEDDKLWRGLESKFSSTKTLCDQLTETLQHLASQVQDGKNKWSSSHLILWNILCFVALSVSYIASPAEKDKGFFESKFNASSEAIDSLNQQMRDMSLRLDAAKENITSSKLLHYSVYDLKCNWYPNIFESKTQEIRNWRSSNSIKNRRKCSI